jgi:hypothetical protein
VRELCRRHLQESHLNSTLLATVYADGDSTAKRVTKGTKSPPKSSHVNPGMSMNKAQLK